MSNIIRGSKYHYSKVLGIIGDTSIEVKKLTMDCLASPGVHTLLDSTERICMFAIPIDSNKYNLHLYKKAEVTGKELKSFGLACKEYMWEATFATSLINFVPIDRKDIQYFMREFGSKRIGNISNQEIMYCVTKGE